MIRRRDSTRMKEGPNEKHRMHVRLSNGTDHMLGAAFLSGCDCSSGGWSRVLPRNKELMGMRSDETYIRDSFFHIDLVNLRISIVCLPAFDKEGIPTSRPAGRVCLSCVGD